MQAADRVICLQDSAPGVPIFVFLSPGVDVAASVEALGRKLGFTIDNGRYTSVALGQGQEPIAMNNLTNAHKNGGWVLLQNIHLTIDWTAGPLEKKVDKLSEGAHPDFRYILRHFCSNGHLICIHSHGQLRVGVSQVVHGPYWSADSWFQVPQHCRIVNNSCLQL